MIRIEPRRPGGFGELLPGEQLAFNALLDTIRRTYEKYGYTPLDTPDLELTHVLLAKGGGETEQQVYSFTREGSKTDLTLRYDLTVPLARYVAEHESELAFPFRRYHIGKVHRAERQQKGRFREFYQCDIDIIGSDSPAADAELPAVINEIFDSFGFGEFTIRVNNRQILTGFFEALGIQGEALQQTLRTVDKVEKLSADDFRKELILVGLTHEQAEQVEAFITLEGTNDETLAALRDFGVENETFHAGVEKLSDVVSLARAIGVPESRLKIDLRIARGLDYYTGTVYETILNEYPELGSVCSGGRYDDLAGYYTKSNLPGVGISIGLSRLFSKLREIPGLISTETQTPATVLVVAIDDAQQVYAQRVASVLRSGDVSTIVHPGGEPLKKKLRFADKMGMRYVVVVGEKEASEETASLKDMESGQTRDVTLAHIVEALR